MKFCKFTTCFAVKKLNNSFCLCRSFKEVLTFSGSVENPCYVLPSFPGLLHASCCVATGGGDAATNGADVSLSCKDPLES